MLAILSICTFLILLSIQSGLGQKKTTQYNITEEAIERFRDALRLKTICWGPGNYNKTALELINQHIKKSYPTLHNSEKVTVKTISEYSLLYEVKGIGGGIPYLLLGHLDVVPVDEQDWLYDPFEASIHDGFIHARGTVDNKHNAFAILETVEELLKSGFEFKKNFFIFLGHDEECSGLEGAVKASEEMEGVRFEWVLDEGLFITRGAFPAVSAPVASIGVAEKGYMTLKLEVKMKGGHASTPPAAYTIPVLANAVARLASNPLPSLLGQGIEVDTFKELADYASFPFSWIYRYASQFSSVLKLLLSRSPVFNALTSTTTAVTMFHAGVKDNVIPSVATAHVNHRVHNLQSLQEVVDYDTKVINDDRVNINVVYSNPPVSASCHEPSTASSCRYYAVIKETIIAVWDDEDIIVAPALMLAATDSRHFKHMADNIYRFSPIELKLNETSMIHGANEKISIQQYARMLYFYKRLITTADSSSSSSSSPSTPSSHHSTYHTDTF